MPRLFAFYPVVAKFDSMNGEWPLIELGNDQHDDQCLWADYLLSGVDNCVIATVYALAH